MENDNNINNFNQQNQVPKNLPKKLPSNLKNNPNNLPPKMPQNVVNKNQQVPPQQKPEKSLEELLSRKQTSTVYIDEAPAKKVTFKSDKQLVKDYKKNVSQAKKLIKSVKKPIIKGAISYKSIKNIFDENISDILYFYPHKKIRNILNQFDAGITITTTPNHKGIITTLVIILLIMAIIASGIYIAYILTKNLGQKTADVDGDIVFHFDDKELTTRLNITEARLNSDLPAKPTVKNNTNANLYVRFSVSLDFEMYAYYTPQNKIEDLSVTCNTNNDKWWLDSTAGFAYYLKELQPNQTETLFDAFQITANDPALEGVWAGRSLVATIQIEVVQVIGEGQEFPPSWSMVWYGMMVD